MSRLHKVWMYHHLDADPFMLAYIQRGAPGLLENWYIHGEWCQCGV